MHGTVAAVDSLGGQSGEVGFADKGRSMPYQVWLKVAPCEFYSSSSSSKTERLLRLRLQPSERCKVSSLPIKSSSHAGISHNSSSPASSMTLSSPSSVCLSSVAPSAVEALVDSSTELSHNSSSPSFVSHSSESRSSSEVPVK